MRFFIPSRLAPRVTFAAFALLAALSGGADAHAAVLTWDGNGATTPNPNGGTGTWNTNSTANWWNGSTNVVWPALGGTDDDALFANSAGTVTISGGVTANDLTFNTSGYAITASTLTLNGTTPTITTAPGVDATISSAVAGTAGLTKAGTGTLTLTGTAPLGYTGATAVNAGTLKLNLTAVGGLTAIGYSSAVNIANSATLELNGSSAASADNAYFNNASLAFTGSGTITKTGTGYLGMLLSTGVKDFTGLIDVQEGILGNNGSGWASGAGAMDLNIASGAILDMRAGNVKVDGLTGGSTAKITSSHNQAVNLSLGNNNGTATFDGTINNGSAVPIAGAFNAGAISLTKVGTGTQTLTGVNTYTGATTIAASGGTLQVGGSGSLGSGNYAGTISIGTGGTLKYSSSATQNLSGSITGAGALIKDTSTSVLTLTGAAALGYTGATTVNAGTLKIAIANVNSGWASTVNVGAAGTLELNSTGATSADSTYFSSGALAFTGSGTITKTGTGYLGMILANGVKDFTGLIDIQQGILGNNGGGWASGAGVMDLNIASGAIFDMRTNNVKIDGLTGGAAAKITSSNVNAVNLSVGNNNGTATYDGTINNGSAVPLGGASNAGVISLTKIGTGTQTLTGVNTYTGATTIAASGGTLRIGGAGSLGSGNYANTIAIGTSGTLRYSSSAAQTFSGNISGAGALVKDTSTSTLNLSGDNSYSGGTTISAGTVRLDLAARGGGYGNVKNFNIGANGTLELYNTNTGIDNLLFTSFNPTGTGTINKTGAGYLDMAWSGGSGNINNFDGAIVVTAGTLGVNFGAQGSGKASLTVKSGGAFDIRTGSLLIDALSDGGGAGGVIGSSFTNVTLSLGNNGGSGAFSGAIQNTIPGGSGGATVALIKNGAGTQILSGANPYSGTTTINAGTLRIDGTHSGNGAYTVAANGTLLVNGAKTGTGAVTVNGTLGGSGTINGTTTIASGGILSPGNSPGVLTFATLNLADGAVVNFEGGDRIDTTNLTIVDDWTLNIFGSPSNWNAGGYTVLFTYVNLPTLTGNWNDPTFGGNLANILAYLGLVEGDLSIANVNGEIRLIGMYAVPEPSTLWLVGIAGIGIIGASARRRSAVVFLSKRC